MSSFGYKSDGMPAVYMTERAFESARVYGVGDIIAEPANMRDIDREVFPAGRPVMGEGDFWSRGTLFTPGAVTLLVRDASGKSPEPRFAQQPTHSSYIPAEDLSGKSTGAILDNRQGLSDLRPTIIEVPVRDFSQLTYAPYLAYGLLERTRTANPTIATWAGKLLGKRGKDMVTLALGEAHEDKVARAADAGAKYPNALRPWVPRHHASYAR